MDTCSRLWSSNFTWKYSSIKLFILNVKFVKYQNLIKIVSSLIRKTKIRILPSFNIHLMYHRQNSEMDDSAQHNEFLYLMFYNVILWTNTIG